MTYAEQYAITKDRLEFEEGFRSGQLGRIIGVRSRYLSFGDSSFSKGYRKGMEGYYAEA